MSRASHLRVFRQACRVGLADFRMFWTARTWAFGWMVRITTNAAMWILLGALLGSRGITEFLLLGYAVAAGATSTLWAVPACYWDRSNGAHALQLAAPGAVFPSLLGRTFVWFVNGCVTGLVAFPILALAFGLHVPAMLWAAFIPIVLLTCFSTYAFSLALGVLVAKVPGFRNVASGVAASALIAFSGALVAPAFWPAWLQTIFQAMPMTHGLVGMRQVAAGEALGPAVVAGVTELAVGLLWLALAYFILNKVVAVERRTGSVDRP